MVPTSRPGVFSRIVAVTDDLAMRFAVRVSRFVIVSLGGLGSGRILRGSMQDDVPVSAAKRRLRTCEWTRSLRGPNATYEAGNPGVPGRSCSYVVIVPFSPRGRTDSPHESWQTVLAKLSNHGNWTQGHATAFGHLLVNSFRVSPINHHPYCTTPKAHPCKPPTKQLSCSVAGPRKRRALFRRPCLTVQ